MRYGSQESKNRNYVIIGKHNLYFSNYDGNNKENVILKNEKKKPLRLSVITPSCSNSRMLEKYATAGLDVHVDNLIIHFVALQRTGGTVLFLRAVRNFPYSPKSSYQLCPLSLPLSLVKLPTIVDRLFVLVHD